MTQSIGDSGQWSVERGQRIRDSGQGREERQARQEKEERRATQVRAGRGRERRGGAGKAG